MSSNSPSGTRSVAPPATSSASPALHVGGTNLKVVGIILAITSGVLIGSSFVFKKKGLIRAAAKSGNEAGEGVAYLKSVLWWTGMSMMILGEICNFAAYAFVEAIVVTPLGALSVVICAILSKFFLKEELTFFGWLGCGLCIIGSVTIALNGPKEESVGQIKEFQKLFLSPGFLAFGSALIAASFVIIFFFAPKYGKKSMLWYIFVCSMIGGLSVSVTTGLGAAIVTTAMGDNQFKYWFMYFLMTFVAITLITEVYYLNVALALFNTAMVTPTYYVIFTFFSMVTTIVLFKGLEASPAQIITIVMAFLTICVGITILQMSKVDPTQLSKLDRRSTLLLSAARSHTEAVDEKDLIAFEDPGMDALRGSFGTVGSIIRARSARRMSRLSQSSGRTTSYRTRPPGAAAPYRSEYNFDMDDPNTNGSYFGGLKRHQLYDAPVPQKSYSVNEPTLPPHKQTIKFGEEDLIHKYHPPGTGDNSATHEQRSNIRPQPQTSNTDQPPESSEVAESSKVSPQAQTLVATPEIDKRRRTPSGVSESGIGTVDLASGYQNSPSPSTLLSFPSVTDSTVSGGSPMSSSWLNVEDDLGSRRSGISSPKKRYPKGSEDDDREESISLWNENQSDEDKDPLDAAPPPSISRVGIRLVKPDTGDHF